MKLEITERELLRLVPVAERNDDRRFLTTIELTPAGLISPGKWNKLYALLAYAREKTHQSYWIYSGTLSIYDVTNRSVEAKAIEDSHTLGEIILNKGVK
jgi:hypothetical protein